VGGVKMYSFGIYSNVSCYQLKIDLYSEDVICEPHGNHKVKTYSKYTKENEKGI